MKLSVLKIKIGENTKVLLFLKETFKIGEFPDADLIVNHPVFRNQGMEIADGVFTKSHSADPEMDPRQDDALPILFSPRLL